MLVISSKLCNYHSTSLLPTPPRQGNHPCSGNRAEELKHGRGPAVHGWLSVHTPVKDDVIWVKQESNTAPPSRLGLSAHTAFLEVLLLKHSPGHWEIPTISSHTHFKGKLQCSHTTLSESLISLGNWQQTISLIYIFVNKPTKQKTLNKYATSHLI